MLRGKSQDEKQHKADPERKRETLIQLIMQDIPYHGSEVTDPLEFARFGRVKNEFRDICSSGENITWDEAPPSSIIRIQGPIIYFAMIKAMKEYVSQEKPWLQGGMDITTFLFNERRLNFRGSNHSARQPPPSSSSQQSMHANGSLLQFLTRNCGVDLNAPYSFQTWHDTGEVTTVQCNAISHFIKHHESGMDINNNNIALLKFLISLGASLTFHFHYNSYDDDDTVQMENHSLLYAALTQSYSLKIGDFLFDRGARFDPMVDQNPMVSVMQRHKSADVIQLFRKYRFMLSPADIVTKGAQDGTPLHYLVRDLPIDQDKVVDLARILIQDLRILPSIVDSKGKTAKDIAEEKLKELEKYPQFYGRKSEIESVKKYIDILEKCLQVERKWQMSLAVNAFLSKNLSHEIHSHIQDSVTGLFTAKKTRESIDRAIKKLNF
jgi:hypothetical protein